MDTKSIKKKENVKTNNCVNIMGKLYELNNIRVGTTYVTLSVCIWKYICWYVGMYIC